MPKIIFWILSFTWGLPMTIVGALVSVVMLLCGFKPKKFIYGYYFIAGYNWGGVSFGPFAIVNKTPSDRIIAHEFGHALQNCYFGPFMVLIALCSVARYWYREFVSSVLKKTLKHKYDDIWFEGTATYLGTLYRDTLVK